MNPLQTHVQLLTRRHFFGRSAGAGLLPTKICHWLAGNERERRSGATIAKQQNARLCVTKQKLSTDQSTLLLLELIRGKSGERSRRHRALTRRELEVHHWLTCGKSNREIAEILGIAPATVSKHLERIYPKLGVENRSAAISASSQPNGREVL